MKPADSPSGLYRVFAYASSDVESCPPALDGCQVAYLSPLSLWSRDVTSNLRHWMGTWWLLCCSRLHASMPRVYSIWIDGKIVHYSFIVPPVGRLQGMAHGDLEIGPCWTHADFRRRGFFRHALARLRYDFGRQGRVFWMVTRQENYASANGIQGAGFGEFGAAARFPCAFLPIHKYNMVSANGDLLSEEIVFGKRDLLVEQVRYNARARKKSGELSGASTELNGAGAVAVVLREPYEVYHELIRREARPGLKVLDLCCGDGMHSITAALAGAEVFAVDIAADGLLIAKARAHQHGVDIHTICAKVESLPFSDGSIDIVTCAGGLSYLDRTTMLAEVRRLLKPGGLFILVDSFDDNWIYRANRFVHWLRRQRTFSTLRRMPDSNFLRQLRETLGDVDVHYFGIFIFLIPVLTRFFDEARVARFLHDSDRAFERYRSLAFKIVILARNDRSTVAPQLAAHAKPSGGRMS